VKAETTTTTLFSSGLAAFFVFRTIVIVGERHTQVHVHTRTSSLPLPHLPFLLFFCFTPASPRGVHRTFVLCTRVLLPCQAKYGLITSSSPSPSLPLIVGTIALVSRPRSQIKEMRVRAISRQGVGLLRRPTLLCLCSISASLRTCSTSSAGSARAQDSANRARSYDQFRQQQQQYHRHSFYEKGSAAPRGGNGGGGGGAANGSSSGSNSQQQDGEKESFSSSSERTKDERVYGNGSATAQQRRQVRQHWEKSFFGRMHFDDGMHSRFAEALASEEEEAYRQSIDGHTHAELFPRWPEDEEAPPAEFKLLRPSLQLRYIVNRLSMGERRIRYAVDYGSLSMMYQLNLGELMVKEAEKLLLELGWMNDDVAAQIDEVKMVAAKIKYDFDLD
jgi:hypothetical protein